ncbi:MAG: type II toxin-antitoxin system RatA family toxin [Azospirillum sp.]|nr:type II toxin-antitoxin system RatA family toxin [Azospirillum sp.]
MSNQLIRREPDVTAEQLFDLVLDVESYPRFVPWYEAARVSDRKPDSYRTDQIVRFAVFRQQFKAITRFERPHWITVSASGGVVKNFDLHWKFSVLDSGGCEVALTFDLSLTTRPLQSLAAKISAEAVKTMLDAFETEAARRFGPTACAIQD